MEYFCCFPTSLSLGAFVIGMLENPCACAPFLHLFKVVGTVVIIFHDPSFAYTSEASFMRSNSHRPRSSPSSREIIILIPPTYALKKMHICRLCAVVWQNLTHVHVGATNRTPSSSFRSSARAPDLEWNLESTHVRPSRSILQHL